MEGLEFKHKKKTKRPPKQMFIVSKQASVCMFANYTLA